MVAVALSIAGSDPSGGAGIQADLKTFHQHGVYGEAVITLITVQNTRGVSRVDVLAPDLVAAQIAAVLEDIPPAAIKTGALGDAQVIEAVAAALSRVQVPVVVDPVMISKHGAPLLAADAAASLVRHLLPRATLLTPNAHEAAHLSGRPVRDAAEAKDAARVILDLGARAVLIKGGHFEGAPVDVLVDAEGALSFEGARFATRHTHGTGCTLSAAITSHLALGATLVDAVREAKAFVAEAIRRAPGLGGGQGPVDHHAPLRGAAKAGA